jgi:predicted AAA+ superfamily ATPase
MNPSKDESILGESTLDVLKKINTWWETGKIPQELVPETKRAFFKEVLGFLDDRRIIGIIGPRRTGKTTSMYHLMDYLIKERNINPRHILFFSGDDVELKTIKPMIGSATKTYFEDYLKLDYRKEQVYIFIDEVHRIKEWQLWLKKYYDLKYNIKFIISGSSAAKIKKEQGESLMGRIIEFTLFPLSFREFLMFNKTEHNLPKIPLTEMDSNAPSSFREIGPNKTLEIKKMFDEYLLAGGFPEWFETKHIQKWHMKLKGDVVKRVIYDDIATHFNVKNPAKLETMLLLLSALQSRTYSYNSIATTLKIDNETAEAYVGYLKESFLIFELQNYASSVEKQMRKNYKYVLVDGGLRNALEHIMDLGKTAEDDMGFIIESSIQKRLCQLAQQQGFKVFYWFLEQEVDVVVLISNQIIPIEVKYRTSIKNRPSGLLNFMEKFKCKRGFVLSKDKLEFSEVDGKEIITIPCWMFLLMLG